MGTPSTLSEGRQPGETVQATVEVDIRRLIDLLAEYGDRWAWDELLSEALAGDPDAVAVRRWSLVGAEVPATLRVEVEGRWTEDGGRRP